MALAVEEEPAPWQSVMLPVEMLRPSRFGPRRRLDPVALQAVAGEVERAGTVLPVLVWRNAGGRYIILEGEPRWRAARRAGVASVPAIVREVMNQREAERLTLVECLRWEHPSALAEAESYARLVKLGLSQRKIAAAVFKTESSISHAIRLLDLPPNVQQMIDMEQLTGRHGRALLRFAHQPSTLRRLAETAVAERWSCARLERERPEDYHLERTG